MCVCVCVCVCVCERERERERDTECLKNNCKLEENSGDIRILEWFAIFHNILNSAVTVFSDSNIKLHILTDRCG